ncbi:MAG: hypothetical protein CMJ48_10645 [Planctomycetaceae bacterium]|nr:hypothetical protein [Planctomycetaceae bacterium]
MKWTGRLSDSQAGRSTDEWRLGNGALDFSRDEVRDYVFRLIEEALRNWSRRGKRIRLIASLANGMPKTIQSDNSVASVLKIGMG